MLYETFAPSDLRALPDGSCSLLSRFPAVAGYVSAYRHPFGLRIRETYIDESGKIQRERESDFQGSGWEDDAYAALRLLGPWQSVKLWPEK